MAHRSKTASARNQCDSGERVLVARRACGIPQYDEGVRGIGASVELHYLDVPKEELWRRIQKRNAELPDDCIPVTELELEEWLSWFTPPDLAELSTYDNFDTTKS